MSATASTGVIMTSTAATTTHAIRCLTYSGYAQLGFASIALVAAVATSVITTTVACVVHIDRAAVADAQWPAYGNGQ